MTTLYSVADRMHETGGVYASTGRTLSASELSPDFKCRLGLSSPRARFVVKLELHACKGQAPYFSATAEAWDRSSKDFVAGGCLHNEILEVWPEAATIVALHLSTWDGVPMHAGANSVYWAAGARGGWGERYHGGNSTPAKTPAECLSILASHLRITEAEALAMCERIEAACPAEWEDEYGRKMRKDAMQRDCDAMRPRWKAEAEAGIAFLLEHTASDWRAESEARLAAMRRHFGAAS